MGKCRKARTVSGGEVFLDARGNGRAMRLTWHHDADIVVLSLWRGDICSGTFRLDLDHVNDFIDALVDGIRDAPGSRVSEPVDSTMPSPIPAPMPPQRHSDDETLVDMAASRRSSPRSAR